MVRRLLETLTSTHAGETRIAKVYRDSEWNEYQVEFYLNGVKQEDATYHTNSREDAVGTARIWINQ